MIFDYVNFGIFLGFLSFIIINNTPVIPEMMSPVSSRIPKLIAAENPSKDQIKGMINKYFATGLSVHKSIPNVKIVVGHGSPNVGD